MSLERSSRVGPSAEMGVPVGTCAHTPDARHPRLSCQGTVPILSASSPSLPSRTLVTLSHTSTRMFLSGAWTTQLKIASRALPRCVSAHLSIPPRSPQVCIHLEACGHPSPCVSPAASTALWRAMYQAHHRSLPPSLTGRPTAPYNSAWPKALQPELLGPRHRHQDRALELRVFCLLKLCCAV